MHTRKEKLQAFSDLLDVLEELRQKCPWDSKQTNQSLRTNTIEEVYELCDALEQEGEAEEACAKQKAGGGSDTASLADVLAHANNEICKELGDVLMHVCFYALFGEEKGAFDFADVCRRLREKLIFRHPHIYGNVKADTPEQVADTWEMVKQKEKDGNKSVLSGVPGALPSLIKAYRIQDKARHVGFDWDDRSQVWDKVKEEIAEFETEVEDLAKAEAVGKSGAELAANTNEKEVQAARDRMEGEFGDVMFSLINAARLYHINPDNALERTNRKFIRRFNYLEAHTLKQGRNLRDMSLQEMDAIWNEAKRHNE